MRKLIVGFVFAFALSLLAANAQPFYNIETVSLGLESIAASSTSNTTAKVEVRKQKEVMLQLSYELSDAGTDATVLTYGFSVDGTAPTAVKYTMLATNTGTTQVVQPLNIDCGGAGYLHILSIENADATGYMTNIVLKYAIKKSAP